MEAFFEKHNNATQYLARLKSSKIFYKNTIEFKISSSSTLHHKIKAYMYYLWYVFLAENNANYQDFKFSE